MFDQLDEQEHDWVTALRGIWPEANHADFPPDNQAGRVESADAARL